MNHIKERMLREHRKANGTTFVSNKQAAKLARREEGAAWVRSTRDELLRKDNLGEQKTAIALSTLGFSFEREHHVFCKVPGNRNAFIDFYVTTVKRGEHVYHCRIALEIDGASHNSPVARAKDRARDADMMRAGVVDVILRVPSHIAIRWSAEQWRNALVSAAGLPKSVVNIQG